MIASRVRKLGRAIGGSIIRDRMVGRVRSADKLDGPFDQESRICEPAADAPPPRPGACGRGAAALDDLVWLRAR